jgi:hypothetical protein
MPSERFTLDLSPRLPVCWPTYDDRYRAPPRARAPCGAREGDGVSTGLLWARDCLPISATHVRRAGTPASRESSSARGCLPLSALPWRRLPVASGSPPLRPGDLQHLVETKERATSFSRLGCLHPLRVLPVGATAALPKKTLAAATSTTGVDSGREMTPRSHAFCRPSPRTPCGGVASFEARTVRLMAPASVEGGSSGNCFSERAWAEHRRVKGTGPVTRWARFPGVPCSPPRYGARAPSVAAAQVSLGLETGTTTPASAKVACVSGSPRRAPAAVQPGCLGRFVSTGTDVGLLRLSDRPI